MDDTSQERKEDKPMKSVDSLVRSAITFLSKTRRKVDVFWLDFNGARVKYAELNYGDRYSVNTFVSHPWIFMDAQSGDRIQGLKQDVYYPLPSTDDHPHTYVLLDIPVYSLEDRCLQVVRQSYSEAEIQALEGSIPSKLIPRLLHKDNTPYLIHMAF